MSLWEVFKLAFVATMGMEVAIAICFLIGKIGKRGKKNGKY